MQVRPGIAPEEGWTDRIEEVVERQADVSGAVGDVCACCQRIPGHRQV